MGVSLLSVLILLIKLIHCGQAKEKPTLTVNPHPTVYNGEPLTLTCDLKISHTGWKFMWYNVSHQLERLTPEYKNTNTLSITASDKGTAEYQCSARIGENDTDYSDPVKITVKKHKPTLRVNPDTTVYTGETFTLTCDLNTSHTGWKFSWYNGSKQLESMKEKGPNTLSITASDTGTTVYVCIAYREVNGSDYGSEYSNNLQITVRGEAQAVLSVSPQSWLTEGDSVTLSCEVRHSSTGWRFSWYRDGQELVSDSRREAGGSYTLSPAALNHTGVYECRATRGKPALHTQTSNPQPLWITASSPPVSLMVGPSRTQHFTEASLSLSCEGQSDSTGWRVRRYTHSEKVSDCTSVWGSGTGSTCSISSLSTSHTGVYWCQSESGGRSYPVNITAHNGDVILDSPVHPVSEGTPLTLRCLYRLPEPSNLSADFYKDGTFLQTQPAGEMIIPAASKIPEGFYHCKHPEKGESPTSWISVRKAGIKGPDTSQLNIGLAVGSSLFVLIIIILGLFCYYKKNKGGGNLGLPTRNQQNTNQRQNVAGPGDSVSIPLQSDDSATQPSDVTYAQVTTTIKKPRGNDAVTSSNDVTYSEIAMKNMKHQNKDPGEPSDVTYAEIDLKPKKKKNKASKGKTTADTDQETIYSKLK